MLHFTEPGVPKKFVLTYGVVKEFTCKDFDPVHISVPCGHQLIVFGATYGSSSRSDNDVTKAVADRLVKDIAVSNSYKVYSDVYNVERRYRSAFQYESLVVIYNYMGSVKTV